MCACVRVCTHILNHILGTNKYGKPDNKAQNLLLGMSSFVKKIKKIGIQIKETFVFFYYYKNVEKKMHICIGLHILQKKWGHYL